MCRQAKVNNPITEWSKLNGRDKVQDLMYHQDNTTSS